MAIYVNRALNFKKIKAIGFDMDYTLVRYNTEEFEREAYNAVLKKLVNDRGYPKGILENTFEFDRVIQGLVIDKRKGNLLKLSRFGKVKQACHGTKPISFSELKNTYQNKVIDLNDDEIQSLDTNFSVSNGVLFSQLVDYKDQNDGLPDYSQMARDIKDMIDVAHRDGTLKGAVRKDIKKYIIQDEQTVRMLERLKSYGKKLLVVTNSDYEYTKLLLDYTITPFLKNHSHWSELFEITVTLSMKPRFFTEKSHYLKVDPTNGNMTNHIGKIEKGVYQGGNSTQLENDLGFSGDEILYLGDHIYGDVVSIKKTCNWRTALVLDPLGDEVEALKKGSDVQNEIDELMEKKESLEAQLNSHYADEHESGKSVNKENINKIFSELESLNEKISQNIVKFQKFFNPNWGELMRAGAEESRFAGQVEKYACIYMAKISDMAEYSPRSYFRPPKRILPHEKLGK